MTRVESKQPRHSVSRPLGKSPKLWVPIGIVLALIVLVAVVALIIFQKAMTARDSLQAAVPLASEAKDLILAGDGDAAAQTVAELGALAGEAQAATDSVIWRSVEWVPVAGENLRAVRLASAAVLTLSTEVLEPATGVSISALKPVDGAIDVQAIADMIPMVDRVAAATESVSEELATLDKSALIDQVAGGVTQLEDALSQLSEMLEPAQTILPMIPSALGADGPRNYLLLFQNNAEIRTTGGNPAAIALITADNGRIEMSQQASSQDFNNNRAEPVIPLDPDTQAIYGERVGTWMQDVTFTPDFTETSELIQAFWAESFGTPVDAVVSFDPVALSYLLEATGPVTLETGDVVSSENAVQLLLNEVYFRYPSNDAQDAFFASAASSIFSAITGGDADVRTLIDALSRSVEEGRLMFVSEDEAQMALIGSSRIAGPLPPSNNETTVLGVFLNDITNGKMDYYLHTEIDAETTQCAVPASEPATFTATIRMNNPIDAALRDALPLSIRAVSYGYHGAIHTDVLLYGPVGTRLQSVEIDGEIVGIGDRWDGEYREMSHLGRPVLQVPILLRMQTAATVTATFVATEDQPSDSFGPFELRATPTVHPTPVTVSAPGCS